MIPIVNDHLESLSVSVFEAAIDYIYRSHARVLDSATSPVRICWTLIQPTEDRFYQLLSGLDDPHEAIYILSTKNETSFTNMRYDMTHQHRLGFHWKFHG